MCRVNLDTIVEFEKLAVKALVKHAGHLFRRVSLGAHQVGTTDVSDEQRIAGQHFPWLVRVQRVDDDDRDTLRGVSWRLEKPEGHFSQRNFVAVQTAR